MNNKKFWCRVLAVAVIVAISSSFYSYANAHIKCPFKVFGATNDSCPIHDHPKVIDRRSPDVPATIRVGKRDYELLSSKLPHGTDRKAQPWSPVRGVYVDPDFTQNERNIIDGIRGGAFTNVFALINVGNNPERIEQCVVNYTSSYREPETRKKWNEFVTTYLSSAGYVFIKRENNAATKELGRAPIGYTDHTGNFLMTLNIAQFQDVVANPFARTGTSAAIDRQRRALQNTLVHEMLHSMGEDHPENVIVNANRSTNVAGNFVYEAGWCIERAGATKQFGQFGLTNNEHGSFVD